MKRCVTGILAVPLLLAGCWNSAETEQDHEQPFAGQTLSVAVPEESGFAEALGAERGEWSAQTGASLEIVSYSARENQETLHSAITAGGALADVLVFPAEAIGELATAGLLAPLEKEVLDLPALAWSEFFPVLRNAIARWGKETTVAVPLGSPVMTCWYRRDLLEAAGLEAPKTWDDLLQLAETLSTESSSGAPMNGKPLALPLGPSTRRVMFLNVAASYAKHPDNFSFFFKIDTMEPMIDGEGFVRALEMLLKLKHFVPVEVLEGDDADARAAFFSGKSAVAATWAVNSTGESFSREEGISVGIAELPGAREVFNPFQQRWVTPDEAEGNRVTFVGWSGWVASVSAGSERRQGAEYLLSRLASDPLGAQLAAISQNAVAFRPSQLGSFASELSEQHWTTEEANAYAATFASILDRPESAVVVDLRIPGRVRYNRALEEGLGRALAGEVDARSALQDVARQWKAITEELGVQEQKAFYNQSLARRSIGSP